LVGTTLLLGAVGLVAGASAAGADTPTATDSFYLALGGSGSLGVQPTLAYPKGQGTTSGYANDLVSYEASRGVSLDLTQLGCSGETTSMMINGDDKCYREHDTQLAEAMVFLVQHHDQSGIVTIDVGFNDLRPCWRNESVNVACADSAIAEIRQQLPTIIDGLEGAAGPNVTFVGVGHYDPYLAAALDGAAGKSFAASTDRVIGRLNEVLESIYDASHVAFAPVGDVFELHDRSSVKLAGVGVVPENVANACELTWMCAPAPLGPNVHPNAEGYEAIALAIESVLPTPWADAPGTGVGADTH